MNPDTFSIRRVGKPGPVINTESILMLIQLCLNLLSVQNVFTRSPDWTRQRRIPTWCPIQRGWVNRELTWFYVGRKVREASGSTKILFTWALTRTLAVTQLNPEAVETEIINLKMSRKEISEILQVPEFMSFTYRTARTKGCS